MSKNKIGFILFLSLFVFYSCTPLTEKKDIIQSFTTNSEKGFTLKNPHDHTISFDIKINGVFPMTIEDMLIEINNIAKEENIDDIEAAWVFVIQNTFHSDPYTQEKWQHHPEILLNSIGYGLCDDRASALAFLWREMGYEVRVYGIEGHVVSEVFHEGKWKMYDADHQVFYLNAQQEVAAIQEIENGDSLIVSKNNDFISPVFANETNLSNRILSLYTSINDNENKTNWHISELKNINQSFILPPNASLFFTYDSLTLIPFIEASIPPYTEGNLYIPFVPTINDGQLATIQIISANITQTFEYNINPTIPHPFSGNIALISTDSLLLKENKNFSSAQNELIQRKKYNYHIERQEVDANSYFSQTSILTQMDSLTMMKDFELFYYSDTAYQKIPLDTAKKKLIALFIRLANESQLSKTELYQVALEHYPKSTFKVYISALKGFEDEFIYDYKNMK